MCGNSPVTRSRTEDGPEHLAEPAVAAVERVVAVVPERVVRAVPDGEAPAGDAVRHATHQRAEVGRVVVVFFSNQTHQH